MPIVVEKNLFAGRVELDSIYDTAHPEKGLLESDSGIDYDVHSFGRNTNRADHEAAIEALWHEKTSSGQTRVYNASKFRLKGLEVKSKESQFVLKVGLTDYRDLLGTHYSKLTNQMVQDGLTDSDGKDPYMYMSNGIGVGAVTLTKDDFVVLVKRAGWTGEGAHKIDRPGGHPEPDLVWEAVNGPSKAHSSPSGCLDLSLYSKLDSALVLSEIFQSPCHELRDEINIPIEDQSPPELLGRILSTQAGGRVSLDFLIHLQLDRYEVQSRYAKGTQSEADESENLIFIPVVQVKDWCVDQEMIHNMTDHCLGGLRLFHLLLKRSAPTPTTTTTTSTTTS
ncbi:hypothetical protein TCAL_02979 [Tigriopus californicus]|uniref:Nudix hydrolase domain-containing protein n=1 Tax=Tigriopus californicus TaxID=6832 RepID=A0A553PS36_TIGCA|nr:uridine diphosphate glucose pyrophosphatase NUDT22-like [Tigriopus californicus]TRY80482.1 hypothetical protein TCAL_02979 [Tigriopus californicus]